MAPSRNDLSELALERSRPAASQPKRRTPWVTRYLVPGLILAGFVALLGISAFDEIVTRHPVTVVPVIVTRAEVQQEGTPLFQAAGWVEPRPTPINVPALTEGVVEELLVVEGEEVQAGQPVARLIDVDARLAFRRAEAQRNLRQAEVESAKAELKAARRTLENPVRLQADLAEAESLLAQTQTTLAQLPFLVKTAEADRDYARTSVEGKRAAKQAIARIMLEKAESEYSVATFRLEDLRQRQPQLEREVETLQSRVNALSSQLELLIDETRRMEDAQGKLKAAKATLEDSEIAVENAQLALDRTTIRVPRSGRVLQLVAHPGTRVMGLEDAGMQNSSIVIRCYDPQMLQVRADVRLEDVPFVLPGQTVEIETASSEDPIRGTVLLPTSSANIQKNTLEAKVAINDPPSVIRPEMLVTATFLAMPTTTPDETENQNYDRLLVPRQLVQSAEGGHVVWVATPDGRAQRKLVQLGKAGSETLVEVIEGLLPTDKVISSDRGNLSPGARIVIAEEDPSMGLVGQL